MAAITQSIQSFINGVSQQPDVSRIPGTMVDVQNGYPDLTFGLQKRPGTKFLYTLETDASQLDNAYWFSIIRSEEQPYIGCIIPPAVAGDEGNIRIWNALDGTECTVNFPVGRGYLTSANRDDYKLLTIDQTSVVLNRSRVVSESSSVTPGSTPTAVSTYADLPTTVDNNYYHILNSQETDKDDYYVVGDGSVWTEVAEPGIPLGFDVSDMPHDLRMTAANTFQFGVGNFTNRLVGDENTNPHPTFVNSNISDVFIYFNRLGILSRDNIILSETLKPTYTLAVPQPISFYSKSAQVTIASDPIDLNAASVRSIQLKSVLPAPQGLILFSDGEQFMMYADQGILTPLTAIIKSISNYELDPVIPPIELGEEFYYVSKTPRFTKVMRMITRGMENDPLVDEATRAAPEYIPSSVNSFVGNSQNRFFALADSNQEYMWFHRTYTRGEQRVMSSWYKWKFPGNVLSCGFIADNMFSVLEADNKVFVVQASLNKVPNTELLVNVPNPNDQFFQPLIGIGPYLDSWTSTLGVPTYDPATKLTTIPVINDYPIIDDPDYKPILILSEDDNLARNVGGEYTAEAGMIYPLTVVPGVGFTAKGNLLADENKFVVGYSFEMIYDLPTTYFRLENTIDNTASLIISRYKFAFSNSGMVQFQINDVDNQNQYNDIDSVTDTEYYKADALPIFRRVMFTVPIYRRNEYFRFRIYSDSPFPATLDKMSWEGQYSPRFYRRG